MGLADPGLRRQKLLRENRHTACQQVLHQALFLLAEFRDGCLFVSDRSHGNRNAFADPLLLVSRGLENGDAQNIRLRNGSHGRVFGPRHEFTPCPRGLKIKPHKSGVVLFRVGARTDDVTLK